MPVWTVSGASLPARMSDRLTDVNAVAVRVRENKSPKTIILVLQSFDDAQSMALTRRMKSVDVVDHHMRHIERRCFMAWLERQVQFRLPLFQNHKADRIAVLERLLESKD